MKNIPHKVIYAVQKIINALPFWGRISFVTFLVFICYSVAILAINFADNILADHRISLFVLISLSANFYVSPKIHRVMRNLAISLSAKAQVTMKMKQKKQARARQPM